MGAVWIVSKLRVSVSGRSSSAFSCGATDLSTECMESLAKIRDIKWPDSNTAAGLVDLDETVNAF